MPANLAIYIPESKPDIPSLFPGTVSDKKLFSAATYYQITLPEVSFGLNVQPIAELDGHLRGFLGYLQTLNGDVPKKQTVAKLIQNTKCVLGLVTDKEFREAPAIWQAVLKVAQRFNGFLFHHNSVVQSDGTPLIGPAYDALMPLKQAIDRLEANPSEESTNRRARNIKKLKQQKIPYIEHLPVLPAAASIKARSSREVAQRALALLLVCAKSDRLNPDELENIRKKYPADSFLTPDESRFFTNSQPTPQEFSQWSWRYEALWVLCWSLQFVPDLGEPFSMCNVTALLEPILKRSAEQFLTDAKLRDYSAILDHTDLIYRYHWAVTDARLHSKPVPGNLNADVVVEWHHALNWLTRYMDADWDGVTTDT